MCSWFDWAVSIWAAYPKAATVSLHNAIVSAKRAGLQFGVLHFPSNLHLVPRKTAPSKMCSW